MQRNIAVVLVSIFLLTQSSAQTDSTEQGSVFGYRFGIGGGMGITAISMNDVVSYLNLLHVPDIYNRITEFSSAVEFFGSFDLFLRPNVATGIEYSYLFGSHNISTGFGTDDFSFSYHMPLLLGHYVVTGANYFFKFGGGLGYLFARYREDLGTLPHPLIYTGSGIGGKVQAIGHTPFGDNLFAYIGLEMRFGFPGSVVDEDGRSLTDGRDDVSLNFFSFGLKFGLMYYF